MNIINENFISTESVHLCIVTIDCSKLFENQNNVNTKTFQETLLSELIELVIYLISKNVVPKQSKYKQLISLNFKKLFIPLSLWNDILSIALERVNLSNAYDIFITESTTQNKEKYISKNSRLMNFINSNKTEADLFKDIDYENILKLSLLEAFKENNITEDDEMNQILEEFHNLEEIILFQQEN
ncbi:hypothetical protein TPHA_0H01060 [Tetrapisispora phaffii CBS 4417]|uniref:Uncharacterized protein n=1 Tax=Tetrapisispora phaffii (strain ATCC 24235 / CBS 4417 / NBRC 1672 / NRRL Y-8282 / UCD 70-5) TaxID=1071381 RepID=G8BX10_TETPH|nr:hypothetical protein TPHA_0H01060 [Tetrapisispora phaffii CBS 4417]CCE64314.1 hypothetical protein TPHA_0H01060 [Tetrapisispora phaffii CBS 4417]